MLGVALKEIALRNSLKVTVFLDSQTTLKKPQSLITGKSQVLKAQIIKKAKLF